MLAVMMEDEDPRFKNSSFLKFLRKINEGKVIISGKEITEVETVEQNVGITNHNEKDNEKLMQ